MQALFLSIYNNLYALMFIATVMNAVAQFCYKIGSEDFLRSPAVWIGVLLYILAFPISLRTFKLCALSKAMPLLSFTLIWSAILGVLFLGETVTWMRLLGGSLIIARSMMVGSDA